MLGQRFTSKFTCDPDGCWTWHAAKDRNGYGLFSKPIAEWQRGTAKHWMAHRYAYEATRGTVPDGLVLDHLCRNTSCVNPDHLEAVTIAENFRRGAGTGAALWDGRRHPKAKSSLPHCKHGHEYTPENTYYRMPEGHRKCRKCIAAASRAYYARKKTG